MSRRGCVPSVEDAGGKASSHEPHRTRCSLNAGAWSAADGVSRGNIVVLARRGVAASARRGRRQGSAVAGHAWGWPTARKETRTKKVERKSKDRADTELRKFYSEILPEKFRRRGATSPNFWLHGVADESKVTLAGSGNRKPIKDSTLTRVSGQVTLVGEYSNVRRFLYEVETAQEFVVIESVELSAASVRRTTTGWSRRWRSPPTTCRTHGDGGVAMKLLPPPGPERRRLIVLLGLLGSRARRWYYMVRDAGTRCPHARGRRRPAPPVPRDTPRSKPADPRRASRRPVPEALKLTGIGEGAGRAGSGPESVPVWRAAATAASSAAATCRRRRPSGAATTAADAADSLKTR